MQPKELTSVQTTERDPPTRKVQEPPPACPHVRVRVIGAGSLGSALAREAVALGCDVELADAVPERAEALAGELGADVVEARASLDEVDLLIEAASQSAVVGHVVEALAAGVDCIVLSTGAFTKPGVLEDALAAMRDSGAVCHLPSGGIAGLDGVKALALEEGASVRLTTRKPPRSLGLEPGTEGELFRGTAREAVVNFPNNVNVAATLLLAGIEPEVRVVADPSISRNTHEVEAVAPRARVHVTIESDPSVLNPATSHMAVLSARALLRDVLAELKVGT